MSTAAAQLAPPLEAQRAIRIIACSLFRELKSHGYASHHVISLASELLQLVIEDARDASSKLRLELVPD